MRSGLVVNNLNYEFLKDINITINVSSLVAIIGKNGSGKTLLVKALSGIVDCKNSVTFNSKTVTYDNTLRTDIGIYLGNINLSDKSVFENLIEPLINIGVNTDDAEKIVYSIVKRMGIGNILYRKVNDLSFSQKALVSLLKSIIHEPKMILLDNPFEALNLYQKNKFINYLNSIKKSSKSIIIYTTNNPEDIMLCDKLIIMNNGKLISYDERNKLLENENLFIKNGIRLPFIIDLSHKLKSYGLIDKTFYSIDEMVDVLWK